MPRLGLRLTPHGHLLLDPAEDAPALGDDVAARLAEAFAGGTGYGLVRLGAGEIGQALPPVFVWWRDFAARYVGAVCLHASSASPDGPAAIDLQALLRTLKPGWNLVGRVHFNDGAHVDPAPALRPRGRCPRAGTT